MALKPTDISSSGKVFVGSTIKGIDNFSDIMNMISEKGSFVLGVDWVHCFTDGSYFIESGDGFERINSDNSHYFGMWCEWLSDRLGEFFDPETDELGLAEEVYEKYIKTRIPWSVYSKDEFLQKMVDLLMGCHPSIRLKSNAKDKMIEFVYNPAKNTGN